MKPKIIEAAGKVWRVLGEKKEIEIGQLPWYVREEEYVVWQALGWLAREDKINYLKRNGDDYIALVDRELQMYRGLYGEKAYGSQAKQEERFSWKKLLEIRIF